MMGGSPQNKIEQQSQAIGSAHPPLARSVQTAPRSDSEDTAESPAPYCLMWKDLLCLGMSCWAEKDRSLLHHFDIANKMKESRRPVYHKKYFRFERYEMFVLRLNTMSRPAQKLCWRAAN